MCLYLSVCIVCMCTYVCIMCACHLYVFGKCSASCSGRVGCLCSDPSAASAGGEQLCATPPRDHAGAERRLPPPADATRRTVGPRTKLGRIYSKTLFSNLLQWFIPEDSKLSKVSHEATYFALIQDFMGRICPQSTHYLCFTQTGVMVVYTDSILKFTS